MKRNVTIWVAWMIVGFWASSLLAQSDVPVSYLKVDYMKVAPGKTAEYLNVEKTIWKPIHRERLKAGKITGWYLYSVMYPRGSSAEYNYVTVSIFDKFTQTEEEYPQELIAMAHPGITNKKMEEMMTRTWAARDLVRSELWQLNDWVWVPSEKPAPYHWANYMRVVPGREQDYLQLEREIWKPIHSTYKRLGHTAGWAVYTLMFPFGTDYPYNFGTVDFYNDYAEIAITVPDSTLQLAHPNSEQINWDKIYAQTFEIRELVRRDLRVLVDYVDQSAVTAGE